MPQPHHSSQWRSRVVSQPAQGRTSSLAPGNLDLLFDTVPTTNYVYHFEKYCVIDWDLDSTQSLTYQYSTKSSITQIKVSFTQSAHSMVPYIYIPFTQLSEFSSWNVGSGNEKEGSDSILRLFIRQLTEIFYKALFSAHTYIVYAKSSITRFVTLI